MVNFKAVKTSLNALGLTKVFINIVIKHHSLLELIISNCNSLFTSKLVFSLHYFFLLIENLSPTFICKKKSDREVEQYNESISLSLG